MTRELTVIPYTSDNNKLVDILNSGLVAIVQDPEGNFEGLITRIDLINQLHLAQTIC